MDDEPDVRQAIIAATADGKAVGLPRIDGEGEAGTMTPVRVSDLTADLEPAPGFAKVLQPKAGLAAMDLVSLDVVLVPGLAFDRRGNRLGRGKGFYDRFLASLAGRESRPVFVGIAFEVQIVEQIPTDAFDVQMDLIVTESGILRTGGSERA